MGHLAQYLVNKIGQVGSGHQAMTSSEEQHPTRFQRNREKTQLGVVRLTSIGIVDVIGVNT